MHLINDSSTQTLRREKEEVQYAYRRRKRLGVRVRQTMTNDGALLVATNMPTERCRKSIQKKIQTLTQVRRKKSPSSHLPAYGPRFFNPPSGGWRTFSNRSGAPHSRGPGRGCVPLVPLKHPVTPPLSVRPKGLRPHKLLRHEAVVLLQYLSASAALLRGRQCHVSVPHLCAQKKCTGKGREGGGKHTRASEADLSF